VNKAPEEIRSDLAIFTFLVFCGLLALLSKYAWGPITEALDNRESKIRQDITDAESAKLKSERLVGEHEAKLAEVQEEGRGIIAEARRDAESTKTDILAVANTEAEATRQRAGEDIDHAKDVALKELFDSLSSRIIGATEHVLGRSISDQDHERLVDEALAQFAESAGNKS
jgi:F-type H+-transporting ATPase subunit b